MKLIKHNSTQFIPLHTKFSCLPPLLRNIKTMGFCMKEICMKTPLVLARAVILVLLIFSSTAIETGALARTLNSMKPPPPPGANEVYDPNSNRPVAPSSPNCATHIPGHCRGRNWWVSKSWCCSISCLYLQCWWRYVGLQSLGSLCTWTTINAS